MKPELDSCAWEHLAPYFTQLQATGPDATDADNTGMSDTPASKSVLDASTLHNTLHLKFIQCNQLLEQHLTHKDQYSFCARAIIFHTDEYVLKRILANENSTTKKTLWPLLQKRIFNTSQGGELFYSILTHILASPDRYSFAVQVFYYCLQQGFKGRLWDLETERDNYIKKCESAIRRSGNQSNLLTANLSDSIARTSSKDARYDLFG